MSIREKPRLYKHYPPPRPNNASLTTATSDRQGLEKVRLDLDCWEPRAKLCKSGKRDDSIQHRNRKAALDVAGMVAERRLRREL
jgi:hypothetical protein